MIRLTKRPVFDEAKDAANKQLSMLREVLGLIQRAKGDRK